MARKGTKFILILFVYVQHDLSFIKAILVQYVTLYINLIIVFEDLSCLQWGSPRKAGDKNGKIV